MGWFRQLFTRRRRYDELSESIREHLEEKIADLTDGGMTRDEAEQAARREFGNVTLIEKRSREVCNGQRWNPCFQTSNYAIRQMRKAPGFSVVVIVILALAMGANFHQAMAGDPQREVHGNQRGGSEEENRQRRNSIGPS